MRAPPGQRLAHGLYTPSAEPAPGGRATGDSASRPSRSAEQKASRKLSTFSHGSMEGPAHIETERSEPPLFMQLTRHARDPATTTSPPARGLAFFTLCFSFKKKVSNSSASSFPSFFESRMPNARFRSSASFLRAKRSYRGGQRGAERTPRGPV